MTKNPERLLEFDFPLNLWVGATIDRQSRVKSTCDAFWDLREEKGFQGITWISCEPMLEPITFSLYPEEGSHLQCFHWVAIGGASRSGNTPAFAPPYDWRHDLYTEAKEFDLPVYMKPNLIQDGWGNRVDWSTRVCEYPISRP